MVEIPPLIDYSIKFILSISVNKSNLTFVFLNIASQDIQEQYNTKQDLIYVLQGKLF